MSDKVNSSSRRKAYLKRLGNPYASLQVADAPSERRRAALSKVDFRVRCRRIFAHYIPALEKGRLRPHHRDFILRNEGRPGPIRHQLVVELQRYDLSAVPGLRGHFNRERDAFTDDKLKRIELSVKASE